MLLPDSKDSIWESMKARPMPEDDHVSERDLNEAFVWRLKKHGVPEGSEFCICGLIPQVCNLYKAHVERTSRILADQNYGKENKPKGRKPNPFSGNMK